MAIIVQQEGGEAQVVQLGGFPQEVDLQRYVCENPQILPIGEIKEDAQFTVLDRETPVVSGSIDILGVDSEGDIYIVETKLFKNSDKRKVLAQVFDYGAAIWRTYQNPEGFLHMLDDRLLARGTNLEGLLEHRFGESAKAVEEGMRDCIESGAFRFVVLMDRVHSELKTLIQFVNRHSNFSVYAVELEHYQYRNFHIFVPHVFGAEERKFVSPSSSGGQWEEASFFQDLEEKMDANIVAAVRNLYRFSNEHADEISWGRGGNTGSFNPKFYFIDPRSLYTVWSNGRITVNFGWLSSDVFRERLRAELKTMPALAKYIPDRGSKSAGIPAEVWAPICGDFIAALERFLTSTKEATHWRDSSSTVNPGEGE